MHVSPTDTHTKKKEGASHHHDRTPLSKAKRLYTTPHRPCLHLLFSILAPVSAPTLAALLSGSEGHPASPFLLPSLSLSRTSVLSVRLCFVHRMPTVFASLSSHLAYVCPQRHVMTLPPLLPLLPLLPLPKFSPTHVKISNPSRLSHRASCPFHESERRRVDLPRRSFLFFGHLRCSSRSLSVCLPGRSAASLSHTHTHTHTHRRVAPSSTAPLAHTAYTRTWSLYVTAPQKKMPNVIVTCTFNPPRVSIHGANIRQDTIDALQKALPKQTSTSMPTQRPDEPARFLLTNGSGVEQSETVNRIEDGNATADGVAEGSQENASMQNSSSRVAPEEVGNAYKSWRIELAKHYCDQKARAMMFLVIIEALEEEGFALRGTNTLTMDTEKDVTQLIFVRS
ncbi:hypothetical protein, unknown function [Leishmania tarentolae]|uniref:Uncharacterized protein n=1 Tax=Leishmania tarentolae TaxID=5689 RepID=A0A640KDA0_LEITA|nr:hypothetical protein, unknown function [Leishmania tarentolae]